MSEPNKPNTPNPSTTQPMQSSELRLLAAELDRTTRALLQMQQERDQARAEAAQATASLLACERALLASEQALAAESRIITLPEAGAWLRPSGHLLVRIVETDEWIPKTDPAGKPMYQTYQDGKVIRDPITQAPLQDMLLSGRKIGTLYINGDELAKGEKSKMDTLSAAIKTALLAPPPPPPKK
jgi:hypothetical protein